MGKGAHGIVLEAVDMRAPKGAPLVVAVKVPRNYNNLDYARAQLHREYNFSDAKLHSADDARARFFLRYLENHAGPEHLMPYLVMELANGDLSWPVLVKRGFTKAPAADKLKVICQLACALTYLAELKLIHRDLRFHNMFLSSDLDLTIGDFGLMRRWGECNQLTAHNEESWKKRDWIPWEARHLRGADAPSGVQSAPENQNSAIDVFSFGVVHFYLCLGQAQTRQILDRVEAGTPAFDGETPPGLVLDSRLAIRTISKQPAERPSPSEILRSLEEGGGVAGGG